MTSLDAVTTPDPGVRVLVTGASGRIGSAFAASCEGSGLALVRADLQDGAPGSSFPFRRLDITDEHACQRACDDVDAVLHLAADPDPASDFRSSILPVNLVGTYNVATAAAASAGVRRFVFASSAHAVAGHPTDRPILETDAPCPANDYGVAKAFGEALCASLAVTSSTAFVSVRIGNYTSTAPGSGSSWRDRASWLSPRDANQLLRLALTRETTGHLVAHGTSDNASKQLSLVATSAALGYAPVDDAWA